MVRVNNTKGRIKIFTSLPFPNGVEPDTERCVNLWRSVLDQVLTDIMYPSPSKLAKQIRREAIYFLNETDSWEQENFTCICALALVNPDFVRDTMFEYLREHFGNDPLAFIQRE